jgi:4-diphosphocytidyl-2-C-methyl-D-erythritol kinase
MKDSIILNAYAKINLYLDVTGKRSDGYHCIKSVMQSISLYDTVTVSKNNSDSIRITCNDSSIPCDETNIAVKAAQKFFNETGCFFGIDIDIVKRIPSQAGLGGGSSDGAAVLTALNQLSQADLSVQKLCKIGALVGADIPFCIMGGTALCEGIGEILTPLRPLPDCYIVIAKGTAGISTKEAYNKIDMLTNKDNSDIPIQSIFNNADISKICSICYNIFEKVSDVSEITSIKEIMYRYGAQVSCMSGSGSAVFGIFTDNVRALKCTEYLKSNNYFSKLCNPVNRK